MAHGNILWIKHVLLFWASRQCWAAQSLWSWCLWAAVKWSWELGIKPAPEPCPSCEHHGCICTFLRSSQLESTHRSSPRFIFLILWPPGQWQCWRITLLTINNSPCPKPEPDPLWTHSPASHFWTRFSLWVWFCSAAGPYFSNIIMWLKSSSEAKAPPLPYLQS